MEAGNYKIIENRPELSNEQLLLAMNFEEVLRNKITPKQFSMGKVLLVCITVVVATLIIWFLITNNSNNVSKENETPPPPIKNSIVVDTISNVGRTPIQKLIPNSIKKKDTAYVSGKPTIEIEEVIEESSYPKPKVVAFKIRGNADAETATQIKDSIYGPTNVSMGHGDYIEYKDQNNIKCTEKNSGWYKFTIQKDTLLTFHIVPTLKTDDYDFALFKCDNYNCLREIKLGKLKPVRYCFSWNTTVNINTGLSNKQKDTTFKAWNYFDQKNGKTYAQGLRVMAGETYYLMINISNTELQNKEPEGFMIYFYNYLPKSRANTYKYPNNYSNPPKEETK